MEEDQFRTSIQELFQSIRFVLSLDSRNSETLIFTQVSERVLDVPSSRLSCFLIRRANPVIASYPLIVWTRFVLSLFSISVSLR